MRKINWLIGSITLGMGMVIGIVGYAAATTPSTGNPLLTKLGIGKEAQMVSSTVKSDAANTDPLNSNTTNSNTASQNILNPSPDLNGNSSLPASASGEESATGNNGSSSVPNELAQKIIGDYKQDIGYFFGAWKAADMIKFRSSLSKAYVGDLYEKHARQAEGYITQGVGMDVSDLRFDEVKVESATVSSATLVATYRYTAQDYRLGEDTSQGEKTEHLVHIRVNLIQSNARWLISGETPLE
ncbi:hypothetical protein ACHOLT_05440 [Desulfitobacterium sp. Sab5]|uniref:hypothetical protein n=1 Tax=Desulfitobacterium nosdiversum TaxID=3375356 RepID=UPI003CE7926E